MADGAATVITSERATPDLDRFLKSLKTIWTHGNARPTSVPKPKSKRERRRPDPLVAVIAELRNWFDQEPWRTGRELLERLQVEKPGGYPDGLLRTVQRRLKVWRSEQAHALVFGATQIATTVAGSDGLTTSRQSGTT